jgi:hypothetical protein
VPPGVDANRLPELRSRRPAAPAALSRLVRSCLLIDMRRRPTAEDVAAKLDGILSRLALEAVTPIPTDDRPPETFGHIEGTDPLRPAVRRDDALALGLHVPTRLTPVRVKPANAPAAPPGDPPANPVAPAPSTNRGLLLAGGAGVLAVGIAAGLALWRSQPSGEEAPAIATAATTVVEGEKADGDAPEPEGAAEDAAAPEPEAVLAEAEGDDAEAEFEPEVEAEPQQEPEPEADTARPDRPPRDTKRSKSKPHPGDPTPTAAHTTDRCAQMRSQAEAAKTSRNWNSVLAKTRERACWTSQAERLLLRVTAYAELERYDECVQTGSGVADSRVATRTKFCRKKGGQ